MRQPCYNYLICLGAILLLALCSLLCLQCLQLLGEPAISFWSRGPPPSPSSRTAHFIAINGLLPVDWSKGRGPGTPVLLQELFTSSPLRSSSPSWPFASFSEGCQDARVHNPFLKKKNSLKSSAQVINFRASYCKIRSHPPRSLILVWSIARFLLANDADKRVSVVFKSPWIFPPAGCLHLLNSSHSLLRSVLRHLKTSSRFSHKVFQGYQQRQITFELRNL